MVILVRRGSRFVRDFNNFHQRPFLEFVFKLVVYALAVRVFGGSLEFPPMP